jgi:protein involved in polysaccharide export with SLBB domain
LLFCIDNVNLTLSAVSHSVAHQLMVRRLFWRVPVLRCARSIYARIIGVLSVAASAAALAACSQPALTSGPQFAVGNSAPAADGIYRIGVGDRVKVTVFNEPNLSGEFEVGGTGQLSLPLIGELNADGLSVADLRRKITSRLSDGYLKDPKVTVDMLNFRPVYVHGEVKSGGEFQYKTGMRLRDAVAMAGGYTYRADLSYVQISRNGGALSSVASSSDFLIQPGDNIRIPERFF